MVRTPVPHHRPDDEILPQGTGQRQPRQPHALQGGTETRRRTATGVLRRDKRRRPRKGVQDREGNPLRGACRPPQHTLRTAQTRRQGCRRTAADALQRRQGVLPDFQQGRRVSGRPRRTEDHPVGRQQIREPDKPGG